MCLFGFTNCTCKSGWWSERVEIVEVNENMHEKLEDEKYSEVLIDHGEDHIPSGK
jgi:hypothetical protein